jgi:hypothetical protein
MKRKGGFFALFLLIVFFFVCLDLKCGYAQKSTPQAKGQNVQAEKAKEPEKQPEKIVPSPKNIKESTAIYVFLVWMWVAIFVLIYILRLKIKEVDRLHKIKFFRAKRE